MINIERKKDCCGCGACAQSCPKMCIALKTDIEGFLYPEIDKEECNNCGLCEKVCPIVNSAKKSENVLGSYVAYSPDDELRAKSSSGGMFSLFANEILRSGGIVYGAAFDDNLLVHHIGIECQDELYKLQGSKYLQSRMEDTYVQVRKHLETGRRVLWTGTACQVSGLKKFLRKEYENLYTIDVLCHGVPSPKVWGKYLAEQEKIHGATVARTFFRKKDSGWKTFTLELQFNDSGVYKQVFTKDLFMQMFLGDICLRPSCHDCKFKALERDSDITIGDAWGIENHCPEMDDNKGASVVIVHSSKGQAFFEEIIPLIKCKNIHTDILLPPTADSRKSVKPHRNRKIFFEKLNDGADFKKLAKLTKPTLYQKCRGFAGDVIGKIE